MAFFWGNPINWLRSYRHLTAFIYDTTDQKREEWARRQAERLGSSEFSFKREDIPDEFSFIALGDTGEGDSSQIVVVDKFLREGADTAFSIIASDVIYPSGRSHEYREKFYVPYRGYQNDIYAVPGNHDWYDELTGFMIHFCDNLRDYTGKRETIDKDKLKTLRAIRRNSYMQPNMYFYMDTRYVRIVFIDTGIKGRIGDKQREWLLRVSNDVEQKPKILISGKPIFVNGTFNDSLKDVNQIVNRFNYRLVIAGDTHNFQKYRIPVNVNGQRRTVWHLVNGGAGAYMNRTHIIPDARDMRFPTDLGIRLESGPSDFKSDFESDFECYPIRKDSEALFGSWFKENAPDALVDRDQPPYHKSFVKVKVQADGLRVPVFGVKNFGDSLQADPITELVIPYHDV